MKNIDKNSRSTHERIHLGTVVRSISVVAPKNDDLHLILYLIHAKI